MKKTFITLLAFITIFTITGCGKKEEKVVKKLTVDEIREIERKYMNSENVFKIIDTQIISNNIVLYGEVSKGSISKHSIVEYINDYGDISKTVVASTTKYGTDTTINTNEKYGIIFVGNKKLNASIIFKRKNYNGIIIEVESKVENIESDKKVKVSIDNKEYNATLVASSYNDVEKKTNIYLIMDSNINNSKKATIKDLKITGKIVEQLK